MYELPIPETASATNSRVRFAPDLAHDVLEELVTQASRVVQSIRGDDLRRDYELPRSDERLESHRIVLERPREAHPFRELGKPVPAERPDPGPAERLDEGPQIEVRGQVGLEDRDARLFGPKASRTQDLHRPGRHPVTELRVLDEVVVREPVEGAGQLFRMDAQTAAQPLECHLRRRILGEELEDLPVVFSEVQRERSDARFAVLRHHRPALRTSAADKSAAARIEREKRDGRGLEVD